MKPREINLFSTSFLDLLSCGMGAVILLCLVFASSKQSSGRVKGETNFFTVSVDSPAEPDRPLIRVYLVVADRQLGPGETAVVQRTKVSIQPAAQGATTVQVVVTGENLSDDDRLYVHLYDLGSHDPAQFTRAAIPPRSVVVKARRVGVGPPSESPDLLLTVEQPVAFTSLKGIENAGYQVRWHRP